MVSISLAHVALTLLEAMDEIVLDYVVERKREDDLVASIVDGRFLEQKVSSLTLPCLMRRCTLVSSQKLGHCPSNLSRGEDR